MTVIRDHIAPFGTRHGLSRKALSGIVRFNPRTIGCVERGDHNPSLELAIKIAERFGMSVPIFAALALSRVAGSVPVGRM